VRALVATLFAVLVAATAAPAAGVQLRIIFPEGWSVRQMADRVFGGAAACDSESPRHPDPHRARLRGGGRDKPPDRRASPRGRSIEGFLFPAGYVFGPSTTANQLIRLQLDAFAAKWSKVDLGTRKPYDVLTVASMIERETVAPEERKLVSAVIWNRLAKRMPLGIDATLRYGLGIQGTRPITAAEQKNQTPYNTGIRPALPPTPIGNPGLPSLQAAAHPAAVDYLYYVRKPDGVHHFFTASEAEFCQKAKEYGYPLLSAAKIA